jgi:DNA gyrase/topoisomerase IV subunit A
VKANQRGTHVAGMVGGGPDAPLAGAVPLVAGTTVVTVSAQGQVKRSDAAEYLDSRHRSIQAAGVKDGDRIVGVTLCRDEDHLVVANDAGLVTRFPADEVRTMGRTAAGVAGMNVPKGATVVALSTVRGGGDAGEIVTVGADGNAKRTPLDEYSAKGRGAKGVQTGVDELRWCGVATDLHLPGDVDVVVRPVDLSEAHRTGRGVDLGAPVGHPVVGEVDADAWRGDDA